MKDEKGTGKKKSQLDQACPEQTRYAAQGLQFCKSVAVVCQDGENWKEHARLSCSILRSDADLQTCTTVIRHQRLLLCCIRCKRK